jgi:small subunit ribosomal protein S20
MANIKSQKKRNRQNEVRRMRNKSIKSDMKTATKKVDAAAESGEASDEVYRDAQRKIDKAAQKGVIHPRAAARKKSRLAKSPAKS